MQLSYNNSSDLKAAGRADKAQVTGLRVPMVVRSMTAIHIRAEHYYADDRVAAVVADLSRDDLRDLRLEFRSPYKFRNARRPRFGVWVRHVVEDALWQQESRVMGAQEADT